MILFNISMHFPRISGITGGSGIDGDTVGITDSVLSGVVVVSVVVGISME